MKAVCLWGSGFATSLALICLKFMPPPDGDPRAGALVLVAAVALIGAARTVK